MACSSAKNIKLVYRGKKVTAATQIIEEVSSICEFSRLASSLFGEML